MAGLVVEELNGDTCECRTYLIADPAMREALVVDPVLERVAEVARGLTDRGLRLAFALDTHTHADHLSGARELARSFGARTAGAPAGSVDLPLAEGATLRVGAASLRCRATPGHTADSLSFLLDEPDAPPRLLSGDTLLVGVTGRTDLPTGDPEAQWRSLEKLFALPDETVLLPGHDYSGESTSTIGRERTTNKRWLLGRERFLAVMREPRPTKPKRLDEALAWNTRPRGAR